MPCDLVGLLHSPEIRRSPASVSATSNDNMFVINSPSDKEVWRGRFVVINGGSRTLRDSRVPHHRVKTNQKKGGMESLRYLIDALLGDQLSDCWKRIASHLS